MADGGRAANGRSSVYRGEDGRWHGRVTMGVRDDGRADRRHVTGRTQREVVQKVRALERARDSGQAAGPGRAPTVETWLTHWVERVAAPGLRVKTLAGYRTAVYRHLVPRLGKHRLDRLTPEHIEAMYAALLADGLAPATVHQVHRTLRTALGEAFARGRVAVNPAVRAKAPRLVEAEDLDESAPTLIVRRALQRHVWQHGCTPAGACGGKRGADCPQRHGGGLVLVPPKSRAGRRTIALPPPLAQALRVHRTHQLEQRLAAGQLWVDRNLVFCQPNGRPLDPRADLRHWKRLLAAAGVRDARLHDARHTAATMLLVQGVDPRTVMDLRCAAVARR